MNDILNTPIKGFTGKVLISLLFVIGSIWGAYYGLSNHMTKIEYIIQLNQLKQGYTDSLQNRDIKDLKLVRK